MKPKQLLPISVLFKTRLLFFCLILFFGTKTFAQSPELTVKGDDAEKVRMSQLKVSVKIVGNIAYTTAEMHFFNSGNRQMEAELIFPLPENVSVSRYAIDINGKMREAVPVNKNKGKQVFEAIEHRRVDPGLLEKVDGNNFKTRIYPLMPNGERIVVIGYEEELSALDKDNLAYQLLSRYPKKLDKFEINVSVLGTAKPVVTGDSEKEIVFSKWNQSFEASVKKENYQPSEKVVFKIPIQEHIPSIVTQNVGGQYYFYGNTFVEGNKINKKTVNSVGLIWGNSLSCKNRDLKKELQLLEGYFQINKNTKVTLYFLNYTFEKQREFVISNGNWTELKTALKNTKYDGGTRFSQISFENQDEYLFFSDGLSSLSENMLPKTKKPVYTITSSVSADFAFLNYASMKTGGTIINLNQISTENALDKLLNTNLKFLGIKENFTVTDLFPMEGTSVSGNFSFSGISLNPKNEITLLFGNGNTVLERKIVLDASSQNTTDINVEKLWAQKKIANLELRYAENADEIEFLGKKYGIVTKNTSLIVLEDIRDYIAYDIIPPAELRAEFDRIKKQEHDNSLAQQKNNWENIENYFNELNDWWKKDIKYKVAKASVKRKVKNAQTVNRSAAETVLQRNENIAAGFISGVVKDQMGDLLPGVNVYLKGQRSSVSTDFDGKFTIQAPENSDLIISFIGYENTEVNVGRNNQITVVLREYSQTLNDIVVVGYGTVKGDPNAVLAVDEPVRARSSAAAPAMVRASEERENDIKRMEESSKLEDVVVAGYSSPKKSVVTGSVQSISAESISKNADVLQTLTGKVAGVAITPSNATMSEVIVRGERNGDISNSVSDITDELVFDNQTKIWNPDRLYLKALASAPKEKQYDLYFELRKSNERNPGFYFDVAHFFYNQGDVKKALQIISNVADLGLENHQLYKTLTYTLRQWKAYNDALFTAKQVAKWRAHEPQSLRDYALTLEDTGKYQEAFDQLVKALEVNYYGEMDGQYEGVEDIILMDINRLMTEHPRLKSGKLDKKYLEKMPVNIRIIMNWNLMDVDLDLHVIEPNGEECYYGHEITEAGARFSKDFTEGYGPEQYIIRNAIKGKYQIKSNFFGETELTENGPATVMVEIYTTKAGKTSRTLKTIQLGKVKENEILAEIDW
ncbi:VIT domain-containing protein [Flavobacterium gelatinilyticum]|uniref:VIT domain-containing protein n=1 Tax=Flavobacterium gelatinilyticum TaxID=3003260 RepID=UPI0024812603|nr:VIT domain-containing protein [Flavobacterium gelatinilyticum]